MKFFALFAVFALVSCETEEAGTDLPQQEDVSAAVKAKLDGFFLDGDAAIPQSMEYPDGSIAQGFMVDDLFFTEDQINAMPNLVANTPEGENIYTEQYRTNNLVSQPRTLTVIGYTGGQFALSTRGRTGLQWAVNNYNRLNLGIRLSLSFATSTNADMVIFDNSVNNGGSGGSAGFPTGGNPHKFIQIFGLAGSSNNVNEHVITHEIGHSVGFRHTDFFSRQSCGQNTNEGTAGVGAIHIPGTPTGFDSTSIMLACFSNSTNGEFNNNDVTALRFLY